MRPSETASPDLACRVGLLLQRFVELSQSNLTLRTAAMIKMFMASVRKLRAKLLPRRIEFDDRRLNYEGLEHRLTLSGTSTVGGFGHGTIQEAIDNARPGDFIRVTPGVYNESVDLSQMGSAVGGRPGDLTLVGLRNDVSIVAKSGRAMFNSSPFNGNLKIRGIGFTSVRNTGLDLDRYNGKLSITKSRFNDNFENGIELSNSTGQIRILDSEINDVRQKAISLSNVENVIINQVEIDAHKMSTEDGIRGVDVDNVRITNSTIRQVGDGLADDGIDLKDPTGRVIIANNTIVDVSDDGTQIEVNDTNSVYVRIANNRISGSSNTFETTRGGLELRTNDAGKINGVISRNRFVGLNDHAIEVALKDASQQSIGVFRNSVTTTSIQSAVVFDTAGTSNAKIDFAANTINDTDGDGLRIIAEGTSELNVVVRNNSLQNIGNGGGDNAIQIESDDDAGATINSRIIRNKIVNVRGIGLYVRGLGSSIHNLAIFGNVFENTNVSSGDASVLIDDEDADDETALHVDLRNNNVNGSNGADAYQLNQRSKGIFTIVGREGTAQKVIENNNDGLPVTISGKIIVVLPN